MQVIVFGDQQFEILLNFFQFAFVELVLVEVDFCLKQMFQIPSFFFDQEEQGLSSGIVTPACSTNSMDVFPDIKRRVVLDNPINLWNIEASCCDISAKEDALFHLAELIKCR